MASLPEALTPNLYSIECGAFVFQLFEKAFSAFAFAHPFVGKFAALDLAEDLFHLRLGLFIDDPSAPRDQVAIVFSRIGNRVTHVADATLVEKVDDELHLVQAFEICHFQGE